MKLRSAMGSLQGAQVSGACAQAGPEHGRGGWSAGVSGGHGTARGTAGCVVCLSGVFPQLAGVCLESLCCALSEPAALSACAQRIINPAEACLASEDPPPSLGGPGPRGEDSRNWAHRNTSCMLATFALLRRCCWCNTTRALPLWDPLSHLVLLSRICGVQG